MPLELRDAGIEGFFAGGFPWKERVLTPLGILGPPAMQHPVR